MSILPKIFFFPEKYVESILLSLFTSINRFLLLYNNDKYRYNIDNLVKFRILSPQSFFFRVLEIVLHCLFALSMAADKPDVHLIHIPFLFFKNLAGDSDFIGLFFSP